MESRIGFSVGLVGCVRLLADVAGSGAFARGSDTVQLGSPDEQATAAPHAPDEPSDPTRYPTAGAAANGEVVDENEGVEAGGKEAEDGATVIGDWWGLDGEARETPYVELVELGVLLFGVGLGRYSLGKRTRLVPPGTEVVSGLYGCHLHRRVVRLGRVSRYHPSLGASSASPGKHCSSGGGRPTSRSRYSPDSSACCRS